jgi:hypothetical protein
MNTRSRKNTKVEKDPVLQVKEKKNRKKRDRSRDKEIAKEEISSKRDINKEMLKISLSSSSKLLLENYFQKFLRHL